MQVSGKWLIVAVILLAVLGGGFSWWHRWHATHRAADWWGPDRVVVLRSPDVVIAREMRPAEGAPSPEAPESEAPRSDETSNPLPIEAGTNRHRDISDFGGVTHLSYALLQDASFDWNAVPPSPPPAWRYALDFQADAEALQVLFSADFRWLARSDADHGVGDAVLAAGPILQQGLRRYFADVFSSPAAETAAQ